MKKDKTVLRDVTFYIFIIVVLVIVVIAQKGRQNANADVEIIGVHIKGEVNAPGYYELQNGSRFKDAVLAAGGETSNADLDGINLALKLIDGEELTIPVKKGDNADNSGKININTADLYQLCKLEGIGSTIADNIIDYRAENGLFKTINQLKKVDGIGSSKFDKIKDKITVE